MKNNKRLEYIRKRFNITDLSNFEGFYEEISTDWDDDVTHYVINNGDDIYAFTHTLNIKGRVKEVIYISELVFNDMLDMDPSKNKENTQWMLNILTNLIKSGEIDESIRFVSEDLPQCSDYLKVFESNKRKKRFKEYCNSNYVLNGIKDPSNIEQYKSLSQLYDAIDPFIERDSTELEETLKTFVKLGLAEIPVRDRKFLVYIPKTNEASVVFDKFSGWCTAKEGNGMFKHYTNYKKPNKTNSTLYIVINTKFFDGDLSNGNLYQLHFETNQIQNRVQSGEDFYNDVLKHSEGISNYIKSELLSMAEDYGKIDGNKYLDYLTKFGWPEALFDMMLNVTPIIRILNKQVPKLPDIGHFKELNQLIICDSGLENIHPSIGNLNNLEVISLPNNNITDLPKEIGNLKNLVYINLLGNKIKTIPEEIKYLDKTNGGSLERISISEKEVNNKNYLKLRELLPSVEF